MTVQVGGSRDDRRLEAAAKMTEYLAEMIVCERRRQSTEMIVEVVETTVTRHRHQSAETLNCRDETA